MTPPTATVDATLAGTLDVCVFSEAVNSSGARSIAMQFRDGSRVFWLQPDGNAVRVVATLPPMRAPTGDAVAVMNLVHDAGLAHRGVDLGVGPDGVVLMATVHMSAGVACGA